MGTEKKLIAEDADASPVTVGALQSVLYSAIGLFLALKAVPQLVEFAAGRLYLNWHRATSPMGAWNATRAIGAAVQHVLHRHPARTSSLRLRAFKTISPCTDKKMEKQLPMTPLMRRYYEHWLATPSLLENPRDTDRFYQFVKACIKRARVSRSGAWLRPFLARDLRGRFAEKHLAGLISKAVSIFDHIVEYERVTFPDPMVEMKNPVLVKIAMRSIKREDGTPFYTDQEITSLIRKRFLNS